MKFETFDESYHKFRAILNFQLGDTEWIYYLIFKIPVKIKVRNETRWYEKKIV